jgi:hypothetical protein
MIEYKDTSSEKLGLAFASKDIDVTALDVIDKKIFEDLEFGILGASHYLKLKVGEDVFTEVFSCEQFKKSEKEITYIDDCEDLILTTKLGNFRYQTSIREHLFVDPEKDILNTMIDDYEAMIYESSILFEFPYKGSPEFTPITMVGVTRVYGSYKIETIHAYPEENKFVTTKTWISYENK